MSCNRGGSSDNPRAGFRLAAPLWNQIQILDARQVSYRKDGRLVMEEALSRMRRSSEWDGHNCEKRHRSGSSDEKRGWCRRWWNEARKVRTERISSFKEVLRLAISWLLILGWVSFYCGRGRGNGGIWSMVDLVMVAVVLVNRCVCNWKILLLLEEMRYILNSLWKFMCARKIKIYNKSSW